MKRKIYLALFWACSLFYLVGCSGNDTYLEANSDSVISVPSDSVSPSPDTSISKVLVHVSGAVVRPGVYELPASSRLYEAIDAAGGVLPDANTALLNLASTISDGMKITVPFERESKDSGAENFIGSSLTSSSISTSVNINTATADQLCTIPGIGPSKANAIIAFREENGWFTSIEDLVNVTGIGESTLKKIKQYVVL